MTEPTPPLPNDPNPPLPLWSSIVRVSLLILLLVWLTSAAGWWGLVIVLGLVLMITLHEFGHYYMAKRAGMKVTEFFIGFGPRLWSMRRGETEYGIKLLPAGAYVRIIGMNSVEPVDPKDESRTYRSMPFWQRFGVAVAGSTMHFIQAFVLVFILLVGFGQPGGRWLSPGNAPPTYVIGSVYANCPAANAGFQSGDRFVSINGVPVDSDSVISRELEGTAGKAVTFKVLRDGKSLTLTPTMIPASEGSSDGRLGVRYGASHAADQRVGVLRAIPQTFYEVGYVGVESVKGIVRIFSPSSIKNYSKQVANARDPKTPDTTTPADAHDVGEPGTSIPAEDLVVSSDKCDAAMNAGNFSSGSGDDTPGDDRFVSILGIFQLGKSAGQASGVAAVLSIFALINIFIGVFNLTPILPFDGGHVVIAVYEKIQERRKGLKTRYLADVNKLLPVVYAVVVVLGLIFVSSIYLDASSPLTFE